MTDADSLAGLRLFIALDPEDYAYVSALTSRFGSSTTIVSCDPRSDIATALRSRIPAPDVVVTSLAAADQWLAGDIATAHFPLVVLADGGDPDAYERVLSGRTGRVEYLKKSPEPNIDLFFSVLDNATRRALGPVAAVNTL